MTDTNDSVMDVRGGQGRLAGDTNAHVMDTLNNREGTGVDRIQESPSGMTPLHHYRTVDSVVIPKEYFEKIRPDERTPRAVLRTVFGNPFPMPLMGFLMASTPLACTLMGWRGAGGQGAALVGVFYFFGGMLQIIGGVMEWIIGNTFPFVVFSSYGAFWLALGATLTPTYNATGAYYSSSDAPAVMAMGEAEYQSTYAFFYMIMAILSTLYTLASIRTNIVLVFTFFNIAMAFIMLMAAYWTLAEGKIAAGGKLTIAAGAFVFTFCMSGWYLWFSLILEALDFPFILPLGDLSQRFPSMTDRLARKAAKEGHAYGQEDGFTEV